MKRKLSLLPAVVFGMAMATGSAFAQIPEIISYQGVDPTNPNATITVNATLYDAATGGTNVWTQQSMPTTDANGMFMMMLFSFINSLVQLLVSNDMRGRVMSIYMVAFRGGMPLGSLVTGSLAKHFAITSVLAVSGALLALLAIGFLLSPSKVKEH